MKTKKLKIPTTHTNYFMTIIFFDEIAVLLNKDTYHSTVVSNSQKDWLLIQSEENIFLALYPISDDDIKSDIYFQKKFSNLLASLKTNDKQIRGWMIGKVKTNKITDIYAKLFPHFPKRFFEKTGIIKITCDNNNLYPEKFPFNFIKLFMKPNKYQMFEKEFQHMEKQKEAKNYIHCLHLMILYLDEYCSKYNQTFISKDEISVLETLQDVAKLLIQKNTLLIEKNNQTSDYSIYTANLINYIQENYADKDLTSYQMAEYLGLSVSRMRVVFKEETGKPINSYLSEVRLKNVCKLLRNSNGTIEKIAQNTGYLDGKQLRRVFKQAYGITPSEYRYSHSII